MSKRKALEEHTDKELRRKYLIENIMNHRKTPWLKPANIIATVAVLLSLLLGKLNMNLTKINDEKSNVINDQTAVLLGEKANVLDKINKSPKPDESELDQGAEADDTRRLVAISKVTESVVRKSGWIYLGQLNSDGRTWKSHSPKTIKKIDFNDLMGSVVDIIDDVYLREDTGEAWKKHEKVVDVGLVGERFKVVEVYESSAKTGGPFIWARVQEKND